MSKTHISTKIWMDLMMVNYVIKVEIFLTLGMRAAATLPPRTT